MASRSPSWWSIALYLALGCGSSERGQESSGAEAGGAGGQGGQTMGTAGVEPAADEPPVIDITGRWGMFVFEDPVAVDIVQNGSEITGLGCDAGLPRPEDGPSSESAWCAPLAGLVTANRAWFEFDIPGYSFRAEVTVSQDASRMAGMFNDVLGTPYSSSWLRLQDDERALASRRSAVQRMPLEGSYMLRLVGAASPGSAFDPLRAYELHYTAGWGIHGDLGAFYYTELSSDATPTGPLLVGPVPATDATLPVSIRLDRNESVFTHATVVDARGVVSEFDVTLGT